VNIALCGAVLASGEMNGWYVAMIALWVAFGVLTPFSSEWKAAPRAFKVGFCLSVASLIAGVVLHCLGLRLAL